MRRRQAWAPWLGLALAVALAAATAAWRPAAAERLVRRSAGLVVQTVRRHPQAVLVAAAGLCGAGWAVVAAVAWRQSRGR